MANVMESLDANTGEDSQISPPSGAAILLVIGEPLTEDHKKLILAEINKGFQSWDVEATGIDINDELAQIANRADLGEEGPNVSPFGIPLKEGERVIRHQSENLGVEILVNPQAQTVTLAVKNFLSTPTKHKHLIYAGHAFQGSGAWILQDDTFTFNNFAYAFKDPDVENAVKQQEGCVLTIYSPAEGDWSNGHITKNDFSKILSVRLNPDNKLDNNHGVLQFTAYVGNFVRLRQLSELLQSSDVVGNIRFSRPTLYIFPGCQGDSALFGISGFNLLVNGGYSRKACFWDFTRHLDRIDATLMTHLGTDNLYGLSSVLKRKSIENVHPEIGYMYLNVSDKMKMATSEDASPKADNGLLVNLAEEGNQLVEYAKQIGQVPQACSRSLSSAQLEPINLYHKVGHGSLDMYILNPITDSKELKEFYQQWNQRVAQFGTQQHVPLPNTLSVCALLVWKPANPQDNITRIFFPGNAPQHKVMEGLEKLKNLDILKQPTCTNKDLSAKPAKKPLTAARPSSARSKASPAPSKPEVVKKTEVTKTETKPTKTRPPLSAPKSKKEDVNKKTSKGAEKMDRSKSSSSSSPSKASTKSLTPSTPKEIVSPVNESTPVKAEPEVAKVEIPAESAPTLPSPLVPEAVTQAPEVSQPVMNGTDGSSVDMPPASSVIEPTPAVPDTSDLMIESESPKPLPDPQDEVEPEVSQLAPPAGVMDKEKLLELGVYDEDQDMDDLTTQPTERVPQMFGSMQDSFHEGLQGSMNEGGMQASMHEGVMQGSMHENMMQGSFHEGMQGSMHEDVMQGSFHGGMQGSMYVEKQNLSDLGIYDDDSAQGTVLTPEDEEPEEEIRPQALPEPQAYSPSSYSQEPDLIPSMPMKEENADTFEPEPTQVVQEPDLLPMKQEPASPCVDEPSTAPVEDEESLTEETDKDLGFEKEVDMQKDELVEKELGETTFQEQDVIAEQEPVAVEEVVQEKEEIEETEKAFVSPVEAEPQEDLLGETVESSEPSDVTQPDSFRMVEDIPKEQEPVPAAPVEERTPSPVELEGDKGFEDQEYEESEEEQSQETSLEPEIAAGMPEVHTQQDSLLDQDSPSVSPLPVEERMSPEQERSASPPPKDQDSPSVSPLPVEERLSPEQERPVSPLPKDGDRASVSPLPVEERMSPEPVTDEQPEQEVVVEEQRQSESPESFERSISPDPELQEEDLDIAKDVEEQERPVSPVPKEEEMDQVEPLEVAPTQAPVPDLMGQETMERELTPDDEEEDEEQMVQQAPAAADMVGFDGREESPAAESEEAEERDDEEDDDQEEEDGEYDSQDERLVAQTDEGPEAEELQGREVTPESESEVTKPQDYRDSLEKEVCQPDDGEEEDEDSSRSSPYEDEEQSDQRQASYSAEKPLLDGQEMTDSGAAGPYDSLGVDTQPSDLLLTPESEATEPSHGMQMEYHQMEEQDGDSVEGVEDEDDKDEDETEQRPAAPSGMDDMWQQGGMGTDFASQQPAAATNPFDIDNQPGYNPFLGMDQQQPLQPQSVNPFEEDCPEAERGPNSFNPLAEWGEPMGLPSPPPPAKSNGVTEEKSPKTKSGAKPTDIKKSDLKKPAPSAASKTKAPTSAAKTAKPSNGVPEKSKSRVSSAPASKPANSRLSLGGGTSKPANPSRLSVGGEKSQNSRLSLGPERKTATKARPTSAPVKGPTPSKIDLKGKTNGTTTAKRATTSRASPTTTKMPPLPPFNPFYVDLTYIPAHGNTSYSDVEFFKRVRARYYVLSSLSPNPQILNCLMEAKKTWEDKELQVTVIPTYDNDKLRSWMNLYKDQLVDLKIEIAPSASRCTIQLQDHETSCSAYRLEF